MMENKRKAPIEGEGLCVNCGDNDHCQFPDFGKRIIYCEEYYCEFPNEREGKRINTIFSHPI
ncbi:hypothetical protein, partial [Desulfosarcina cetonica]|uniref:hypothetical protein n=1 Tax=Desulfosarcina cetonica TaxID=90730 RepID=UPI001C462B8E